MCKQCAMCFVISHSAHFSQLSSCRLLRLEGAFLPNDVDIWKHQNKHAHRPIGTRPYFDISAPHVCSQPWHNNVCGNKRRWYTSIFKQKPTQISCVKQCKINVTHLSKRNNATLASDSSPSRSLSSLHRCSDIYAGLTSCLIVTLLCNVLFLRYFSLFYLPVLSIYSRSANIRPVHSNWALYHTNHAPYCWLATSVFWDMVRHCGQKRFSKIA